jgi:hypothetical protein
MQFDEIIPILPNGPVLKLLGPNTHLERAEPFTQALSAVYNKIFERWGQTLIYHDGHNIILDYFEEYTQDPQTVTVCMEYQGCVVGGLMMRFGQSEEVLADVVRSVLASYDLPLDWQNYDDPIFDPINQLHNALQHETRGDCVEISEIFIDKPALKSLISTHLDEIQTDFLNSGFVTNGYKSGYGAYYSATRDAIQRLTGSFKQANRFQRRQRDQLVHDIYRLFSMELLLAGLVFSYNVAGFSAHTTTCYQWTCKGTEVYSLFNMLSGSAVRRQMLSILDKPWPMLGRIVSRLPGNNMLVDSLINLVQNSSIIFEEEVGDGTRPHSHRYDYNVVAVSRFPLDGIIALTYDWNVYNMVVRRRLLRMGVQYIRSRVRSR